MAKDKRNCLGDQRTKELFPKSNFKEISFGFVFCRVELKMLDHWCIKNISKLFEKIYKPKPEWIAAILTYHGVNERQAKGCLPLRKFVAHLDFLSEAFNIVKLSELVEILRRGKRDKEKYVAITFDDAYDNFYHYAYPELRKRKIPATQFVPTAFVGGFNSWDYKQGKDNPFLKIMKWEELRRLDTNLIEVGSHGHSHKHMADLKEEELKVEIVKSKEILELELNSQVDSFAYPYGELFSFDERAVRILKESGYRYAFTTHFGRSSSCSDLYRLKRISIWEDDEIQDIKAKLLGYYDWLGPKERIAFLIRQFLKKGRSLPV
jgi:peptidoglycan/xylan/chitin deacetylase (PgdA/CDA1 family)